MRQESLPPLKEIYGALESAAVDLYGFAVVCYGGARWAAEPALLETLLLGLENTWFTEDSTDRVTHQDFREDLFRSLWDRLKGQRVDIRIGTDVPLGHQEMAFYQLPQLARAALYLRTKKRFSYTSTALILGTPEPQIRDEVERAREFLLGRRVKPLEWSEEDF